MAPNSHPTTTIAPQLLSRDYRASDLPESGPNPLHQGMSGGSHQGDAMTSADAQSLVDFAALETDPLDCTLWQPSSADMAEFSAEFPTAFPDKKSSSGSSQEASVGVLQQEIRAQRQEHERLCDDLQRAMAEIRKMSAKLNKILSMTEELTMWSGALNPLVSALLERMGDATGDPVLSEKIESWLDLAE